MAWSKPYLLSTIYTGALLGALLFFLPAIGQSKVTSQGFSTYLDILDKSRQNKDLKVPNYRIVIPNPSPDIDFKQQDIKQIVLPETSVTFYQTSDKSVKEEARDDTTPRIAHDPSLYFAEPVETEAVSAGKAVYDGEIAQTEHKGNIAIIIDDIGNNKALDIRAAHLHGKITLAILPHTPFSQEVAELAFNNNKEIILHAPMENDLNRPLGQGALTQALTEQEFIQVLQAGIDAIPHVSGMNNHMGSLLTKDLTAMHWVMQTLEKNQLFFIDSRTTAESVADQLAAEYGIIHASRNVFLDNEQTHEYIDDAFKKTLKLSEKTGFALAIGHPYPATIAYLEKVLPQLDAQGYHLLNASELATISTQKKLAKSQAKEFAKK